MDSFQITTVGDGAVGKTSLLLRYTTDTITIGYEPTVFENYAGKIAVDDKEYNIRLWDTAGQEDYDRIRPLCYKMTNCFLICYSVDSFNSYDNVRTKWAPEINQFMPKTPIILIGTKIDLRDDPKNYCLTYDDGTKLARLIKAKKYVECSSHTRVGVEEVFREALRVNLSQMNNNRRRKNCLIF